MFGPSEARENSGEAMLWFLGRLRKELGVDEFVETEAKANKWVQDSCLPEMFWQNVGHHSMEMVMVQDRVAPHALSYCTWLLDYADAKDKASPEIKALEAKIRSVGEKWKKTAPRINKDFSEAFPEKFQ